MRAFHPTVALTLAGVIAACSPSPRSPGANYLPRTRALTVTTVPLLVREGATVYPFLKPDFAAGGVLDGKEVYGFSPSTLTVVQGDTIAFTFVNPEDDLHSFALPDFAVLLPGQKITRASYIARRAGIFTISCTVASHLPMMSGQLVVLLAASVGPQSDPAIAAPPTTPSP
jgi:plastocyanin